MTDVVLDWIEIYVSNPELYNNTALNGFMERIMEEQFFARHRKWIELDKIRLEEIVLKINLPKNTTMKKRIINHYQKLVERSISEDKDRG